MFYKLCAKCGAVIPLGETYCAECKPERKATREELKIDDSEEMDAKAEAFYNSRQWRTTICVLTARRTVACQWLRMCITSSALSRIGISDLIHQTAYHCARRATTRQTVRACLYPTGV